MSSFPLSQKYIDFINSTKNATADFLEGTTASGKTTVGAGVKFMRMVSASRKKLHVIAAKTTGKAEETIIQQDNGILDLHRNARYYGNGDKDYKLPHIKFEGKIIYVLGYDNKDKWEMVLGAQFGCVYIDEINTADIEFVREMSTRNDYLIATLNPDDPNLPVYKEFINRSRPYQKYAKDVPPEIMAELIEEPVPNWRYWFFSFRDNLSLTDEDIQRKILAAPKGTKLYKNKILGLRGRATGLVFSNFDRQRHIKSKEWAKQQTFTQYSAGLDTAYSQKSPDTIAMSFIGVTKNGVCVLLDERVFQDQRLELRRDENGVEVVHLRHHGSGFLIVGGGVLKVLTYPVFQLLGLAYIDDLAGFVHHQINPRQQGQVVGFFPQLLLGHGAPPDWRISSSIAQIFSGRKLHFPTDAV